MWESIFVQLNLIWLLFVLWPSSVALTNLDDADNARRSYEQAVQLDEYVLQTLICAGKSIKDRTSGVKVSVFCLAGQTRWWTWTLRCSCIIRAIRRPPCCSFKRWREESTLRSTITATLSLTQRYWTLVLFWPKSVHLDITRPSRITPNVTKQSFCS